MGDHINVHRTHTLSCTYAHTIHKDFLNVIFLVNPILRHKYI